MELPNVKRAATWPKSVHWLAVVALALVGPASFLGFILGCMVYAWTEVAKITWPGLMTLFRWLRFTVIDCFMRRLAV
ncbi:MAG TPA: hypothetical protein VLG92_00425 [Candidatus Saccharimonadia bacterium]|nr:hypothetical protein [Candidatus Saccharimonadia bacterium]